LVTIAQMWDEYDSVSYGATPKHVFYAGVMSLYNSLLQENIAQTRSALLQGKNLQGQWLEDWIDRVGDEMQREAVSSQGGGV
jgi:hypothetical protein